MLARETWSHDPFSKLAPELLLLLIMRLPMDSLNCLRAASPAVSRMQLDNVFWKQRLRQDMPWLYDLPEHTTDFPDDEVDWARVYRDLLHKSIHKDKLQIHGLVNRRRIFDISKQIALPYARKKIRQEMADDRQ